MALKIVKSARHYTETAVDEIELLKKVFLCTVYTSRVSNTSGYCELAY